MYSVNDTLQAGWVFPFGDPRIKARLSAPRGISQISTSFIAYYRLGIHRMRLFTWPYNPKQPFLAWSFYASLRCVFCSLGHIQDVCSRRSQKPRLDKRKNLGAKTPKNFVTDWSDDVFCMKRLLSTKTTKMKISLLIQMQMALSYRGFTLSVSKVQKLYVALYMMQH